MKKSKPTFVWMVVALVLGQAATAQEIAANTPKASPSIAYARPVNSHTTDGGAPVLENPEAKLVSRFATRFPDATHQEWRMVGNSYYVSFMNKGRKARALFTCHGNMNYAITDCTLEQLPEALRRKIATDYPGYALLKAVEINAYDVVAHQVVLESASVYVTVKATNDGIEEVGMQVKAVGVQEQK